MNKKRSNWVDGIRGLAVIGMVLYHIFFLLDFMEVFHVNLEGSFLFQFLANIIRFLFFLVVGISSFLLFSRYKAEILLRKQLKRVVKILYAAIAITLITFFSYPEYTVYFGVMHSIALGILISFFLAKYKDISFYIALGIFAFSLLSRCTDILYPVSYIIGISCSILPSFDYFPLFPWLGFIFLGQSMGRDLVKLENRSSFVFLPFLVQIGRHAFVLYLLHVPIIFLLLVVFRQFI